MVLQVVRLAGVRDRLTLDELAGEDRAVLQRELLDPRRPEDAETVREDDDQEAEDHEQADPEGAPRQPDEVLASRETKR